MKILIICAGNTCRSPMAGVILKTARPDWEVTTRGTFVDHEQKTANKLAIHLYPSLVDHKPTELMDSELSKHDLILTMTPRITVELINWYGLRSQTPLVAFNIPDPLGSKAGLKAYQHAAQSIIAGYRTMGWIDDDQALILDPTNAAA